MYVYQYETVVQKLEIKNIIIIVVLVGRSWIMLQNQLKFQPIETSFIFFTANDPLSLSLLSLLLLYSVLLCTSSRNIT